jgi:hypothetical protein
MVTSDGGGRALARPEESLVDLFLRKVPRLDLDDHGIDKLDFGLQPRFEANDQAVVERNRLAWLGRIDVDLFDFVGHGALHNTAADSRGENERRARNQSSETHGEPPKRMLKKLQPEGAARRGGYV